MTVIGSFHKLPLIMHITKKHRDWEIIISDKNTDF